MEKLDQDYQINHSFLKMKFNDFSQTTVERQHCNPTLKDLTMLCEQAWQRGQIPVRLLGVGVRLNDLTENGGQMELFGR
jgi:DNA polymerase-4